MTTTSWAISGDFPPIATAIALTLAACALMLVLLEAVGVSRARNERRIAPTETLAILLTGLLALTGLLGALLRPVHITERGSAIGPRIVVLADASRSMDLPGIGGTRRAALDRALASLLRRPGARFSVFAFGIGPATPWQTATNQPAGAAAATQRPMLGSDLSSAIESIARAEQERPSAIIVLSDGRLDRPSELAPGEGVIAALGSLSMPVHTVPMAVDSVPDASIRRIRTSGAAVAHQAFSVTVEVACSGGLACESIAVMARELRQSGPPVELARGIAHVSNSVATVELELTIEQAGARIVEVTLATPDGDTIPENNRRLLNLQVGRDRVRVLHIAGRPTYDVRALRMWLKSDASLDVVAFFILRTRESQVAAPPSELALIPFPVHELFTEQLPTFDAVVLQDFDAAENGLTKHLPNLAAYVRGGGGLIMVGGPGSFVAGHYANTALSEVLPVTLEGEIQAASDLAPFVPLMPPTARLSPVLARLRSVIDADWPEMLGTNVVGDARPGASVLLTHPTRTTRHGHPMPVLALGEYGSGRSIALTIDGSHRLLFSNFAARETGRAHGAFWDGLLGWLMRDPRFEPATIDVRGGCIAGIDTTLAVTPLGGHAGQATLELVTLGSGVQLRSYQVALDGTGNPVTIPVGKLDAGAYSAVFHLANGALTRRDFACEVGGEEWSDSRPDPDRLRAIARATGGEFLDIAQLDSLQLPAGTRVTTERQVRPLVPAWLWALWATTFLGIHWIVRRRAGLA